MHTPSKFLVAIAATMLLTASAALADHEVRRIDHPNGQSTYSVKPSKRTTTIALDARGQGIATADAGSASKRTVRIQMGRGQYVPVRIK